MVPKFNVQVEVRTNKVEETLNELAATGWELIPQTFQWDSSMRNASWVMISVPAAGGVTPEPTATEPLAKAA